MDQHSHFVESRNQLYLQLRSSLADNVDFSKPQEKINTLNTKWKIVQGGVETNCRNLEECYKLLKSFEENARKMRSWALESDLSQVRHFYSTRILLSHLVIGAIALHITIPTFRCVCFRLIVYVGLVSRSTSRLVVLSVMLWSSAYFSSFRLLTKNLKKFRLHVTTFCKHMNNSELSFLTNKSNDVWRVKPSLLRKSGVKCTTVKRNALLRVMLMSYDPR